MAALKTVSVELVVSLGALLAELEVSATETTEADEV